ncbi:hypothetical protein E8E11_000506 [Didymella keratinophila]|nr:hypothetical protein E8E11_000506 [Didymella keratinophila]
MAAHRTLSWLQAEKAADIRHVPTSTSTSAQQSSATTPTGSIEIVPVSVSIPTDMNIGEPTRLSKTLVSVLERPVEAAQIEVQTHFPHQSVSKPSASSKILNIDDLDIYMAACAEYSRGLAAGRTE